MVDIPNICTLHWASQPVKRFSQLEVTADWLAKLTPIPTGMDNPRKRKRETTRKSSGNTSKKDTSTKREDTSSGLCCPS